MRKRLLKVSLLAITLLLSSTSARAQITPSRQRTYANLSKTTKTEKALRHEAFVKAHPQLFMGQDPAVKKHIRMTDFASAKTNLHVSAPRVTARPPLLAAGNIATIWANVNYDPNWPEDEDRSGVYSFNPIEPFNFNMLTEPLQYAFFRHGVQLKDGRLYGLYFVPSEDGPYYIVSDYDTNTWEGTSFEFDASDYSLYAQETAQAADGTVYGEFWNSNFNAHELATVDYSTGGEPVRSAAIATLNNYYVALGITSDNILYGIALDGNLYKITTDGTETLVGPTGVGVSYHVEGRDDPFYYYQTGEIDQTDNTFYWFGIDSTGVSGLYNVDLATGHANLIGDLEGKYAQGMVIPERDAAAGAPAEADTAYVERQSYKDHNVNIVFDVPTLSFDGTTQLTGEIGYSVYDVKPNADGKLYMKGKDVPGEEILSGTAAPGAHISQNVTINEDGYHQLYLVFKNNAGLSPAYNFNVVIGSDTPYPVRNLKETSDGQNITVTWDAPTETGIHNSEVDLDNIVYDVYRVANNDTVKVADGISATTFSDPFPATSSITYYIYGVQARVGSFASDTEWVSDGVVSGGAIDGSNWTIDINGNNWPIFDVLDVNNDGKTWSFSGEDAMSDFNSSEANDDWLVTPPIKLESSYIYTLSFSARNASQSYSNTIDVKYGSNVDYSSATTTADSAQALQYPIAEGIEPSDQWTHYSEEVSPSADGEYRFGFHDISPADRFHFYVDSISIKKGPNVSGPDSVNSLTVTPGAMGALTATVKFNIASTTVGGASLAKADSAVIYRDDDWIANVNGGNAGEEITYADNSVPTDGFHKYTVVSYTDGKGGRSNSSTAYIGIDTPTEPLNTVLYDKETSITAKWPAVPNKGANGGYVDPKSVSVSLYTINNNYVGDSITTSNAGANEVSFNQNTDVAASDPSSSTQELYTLAARANNQAGQSGFVQTSAIVVGPSIAAPFSESFAGGNIDNNFAWVEQPVYSDDTHNIAGWVLDTQSSDNDGGSAIWYPHQETDWFNYYDLEIKDGDVASINSPKINLRGTVNPRLYFDVKTIENEPAILKIIVATPDGTEHEAASYDLSNEGEGWTTLSADLTPYSSERYVIVKFRGVATGESPNVGLDNIYAFDQLSHNLAAFKFVTPRTVRAGRKATADVIVKNFGANPESNYKVTLYADNKAVDSVTVNNELGVMQNDTVTLSFPVAVNKEDVELRAEVKAASVDLDDDDNSTETYLATIMPSEYTKVSDLAAAAGKSDVNLTWTKPVMPQPTEVTEDFESYEPFATELGNWTLVDGDKGITGSIFGDYDYPGQGTPFAFDAFNPNAITSDFNVLENNPGFTPHSGNQFAAAFYVSKDDNFIDENNWLISPELSGKAQTIKFYAMNIAGDDDIEYDEKFDVLYSTTGVDTADFKLISNEVADGTVNSRRGANWKEISVDIPEGAKYFAIHHNSDPANSFVFGLDDITFEKGVAGANDSIISYNVYRDGELIGSVKSIGEALAFTDSEADDGSHIYNVTVLYLSNNGDINESGFSNDASIIVSGIDNIKANTDGTYNVYTIDGKTVMLNAKSLNGLTRGVYIINDKKYIVR